MEFMNRSGRQTHPSGSDNQSVNVASPANSSNNRSHSGKSGGSSGMKLLSIVFLFAVTVLLVALIWYMVIGGNKDNGGATTGARELQHVETDKLQAVFLNGGQVYFGRIQNLNSEYMKLNNIYYLRVSQQVQPDRNSGQASQNDISLVKLGCELHGPTDEMVVNREQVIFWENLKTDGQVAEAVKEFEEQNPNGQQCEQPAGQTNGGGGTESGTEITP